MDVYPKFIIEDGALIISKCTYHKDIAENKDNVIGGGWFDYRHDDKVFQFYGKSEDFGPVSIEDIKKCIEAGEVYTDEYKMNNIAEEFSFEHMSDTGELTKLDKDE